MVGEETIAGEPRKIYRPDTLKSVGLTNHPNLPVHLLNEAMVRAVFADPPESKTLLPGPAKTDRNYEYPPQSQTQPTDMNQQIILNFLASQGFAFANEFTDHQLTSALDQLGHRLAAAETTLAARGVECEHLQAELANEREFHRDTLLERALSAGTITAAQRPDWAARLTTDFANASTALTQLQPALKTTALTLNLGARKAEIANATDRRDMLDTLVKAELAINGGDYDRAFTAVQKANPALFSAMKQPTQ